MPVHQKFVVTVEKERNQRNHVCNQGVVIQNTEMNIKINVTFAVIFAVNQVQTYAYFPQAYEILPSPAWGHARVSNERASD